MSEEPKEIKKYIYEGPQIRSLTHQSSIGPGTVVSLKSGGPSMTVIERSTNWAYVLWHKDDGNDVLKDWVPVACLEVKK